MLKQSLKDIYFSLNRVLVLPNTCLWNLRLRSKRDLYVHLGCGPDYLPDFLNVDGNIQRKKDLWLDLRNKLPFATESVRFIYCSHMLEHLFPDDAIILLKELHRCLQDDGRIRLAVPSFEYCLKVASGVVEKKWPRSFTDSKSQALNYLFCDGQHKYGYCDENLRDFCEQAGFTEILNYSREHGSKEREYFGVTVGNEPEGSLILELAK